MRMFLSGAMSSRTREEYTEAFSQAEERLRKEGYEVFNPCRWYWFLKYLPYQFALVFDLFMLCYCDRIYMLKGWIDSPGARVELDFAIATGKIIEYEE